MAHKLKRQPGQPISIILVSGIPGSGKGRLANTIAKLLAPDQLKTAFFKMPTV
jgi:tRNA uridine 5-carbamoylmethylation protein Kti12